jgi:hypothetical protein
MPGLSFWTCALGKDSAIFLGVALMVFAMASLRRRYVWMAVAMSLLFIVRPYILIVPVVALGVLVLVNKRIPIGWRVGGVIVILGLGAVIAPAIMKYVSLSSLNADDIANYVSTRQGYNIEGGGGVDISSYNIIEKILSYLFMPLFFGAANTLGIFASIENLVLLLLIAGAGWIGRREWRRVIAQPAGLYHLTFAAAGVVMQANVTANLGIAVRQKEMFIPSLLYVCILLLRSAWMSRAARRAARPSQSAAFTGGLASYRGASPFAVGVPAEPSPRPSLRS